MPTQFPERDWREFKRVHAELLERFCAQILDEVMAAATSTGCTAGERYDLVHDVLKKRDRDFRNAFGDFRRSTAELQLTIMRNMGLLTDTGLGGFSEETQARIRELDSITGHEVTQ